MTRPFEADAFREGGVRPSMRCDWDACEARAYQSASMTVIPEGSGVARLVTVHFCPWHSDVAARAARDPSIRVRLRAHPDDVNFR